MGTEIGADALDPLTLSEIGQIAMSLKQILMCPEDCVVFRSMFFSLFNTLVHTWMYYDSSLYYTYAAKYIQQAVSMCRPSVLLYVFCSSTLSVAALVLLCFYIRYLCKIFL